MPKAPWGPTSLTLTIWDANKAEIEQQKSLRVQSVLLRGDTIILFLPRIFAYLNELFRQFQQPVAALYAFSPIFGYSVDPQQGAAQGPVIDAMESESPLLLAPFLTAAR